MHDERDCTCRLRQSHQGHLETLEREGFVVLENVLDERRCRKLKPRSSSRCSRRRRAARAISTAGTRRASAAFSRRRQACATWCLIPTSSRSPRRCCIPNCDCIQLNLTQAVRVHGQERPQAPHRDEEMWPCPTQGRHWLLNVMWAVSDFTEENGATRLWPGSHRDALDRGARSSGEHRRRNEDAARRCFSWARSRMARART